MSNVANQVCVVTHQMEFGLCQNSGNRKMGEKKIAIIKKYDLGRFTKVLLTQAILLAFLLPIFLRSLCAAPRFSCLPP